MPISISDNADEFRIEITGLFSGSAVNEVETAWTAALKTNTPRRISVDITRMTAYDEQGYSLLRGFYRHGTNIVAGTPNSLQFLDQISSASRTLTAPVVLEPVQKLKRTSPNNLLAFPRAIAAGE